MSAAGLDPHAALVEDLRGQVLEAAAAGRRLTPVGGRTQLGWCRPDHDGPGGPGSLDLSGLRGVVEYEPGEGTVTAWAGTPWSELATTVAAGGHRLPADLCTRPSSTVGGVLASGRSGPDRFQAQALRHHVLGMQVLVGDGTVARSGGRLVKNVTGFDLHRLHVGARGTLGAILEVSLRLRPLPECEAVVALEATELEAALDAVADLVRAGARLQWGTLRPGASGPLLELGLDGRRSQVEQDAAAAAAALGSAATIAWDADAAVRREATRDMGCEDGHAWEVQGTRAAVLSRAASGCPQGSWFDLLSGRLLTSTRPSEAPGLRIRRLADAPTVPDRRGQAWEERIRSQLDPTGVFAMGSQQPADEEVSA